MDDTDGMGDLGEGITKVNGKRGKARALKYQYIKQ